MLAFLSCHADLSADLSPGDLAGLSAADLAERAAAGDRAALARALDLLARVEDGEDAEAAEAARSVAAPFAPGALLWKTEVANPFTAAAGARGIFLVAAGIGGGAAFHDLATGKRIWNRELKTQGNGMTTRGVNAPQYVRPGPQAFFSGGNEGGMGTPSHLAAYAPADGSPLWREALGAVPVLMCEGTPFGLFSGTVRDAGDPEEIPLLTVDLAMRDAVTGKTTWTKTVSLDPRAAVPTDDGVLVAGSRTEDAGERIWVGLLDGESGAVAWEASLRGFPSVCEIATSAAGVLIAGEEGSIGFLPKGRKELAWTSRLELDGAFRRHDRCPVPFTEEEGARIDRDPALAAAARKPVHAVRFLPGRLLVVTFFPKGALEVRSYRVRTDAAPGQEPLALQWTNAFRLPDLARVVAILPEGILASWVLPGTKKGQLFDFRRAALALFRWKGASQE